MHGHAHENVRRVVVTPVISAEVDLLRVCARGAKSWEIILIYFLVVTNSFSSESRKASDACSIRNTTFVDSWACLSCLGLVSNHIGFYKAFLSCMRPSRTYLSGMGHSSADPSIWSDSLLNPVLQGRIDLTHKFVSK